jgi:hypothetical protein
MPDPSEAAIVREIIRLSRRGCRAAAIMSALNHQGARRRNGTHWTARQVRAVLSRRDLYEHGRIHYGSVDGQSDKLILIRKSDA